MKKFFVALTMLAIFLTSSLAFAAFEDSVEEGADVTVVKKLAVAMPDYYKVEDTEPDVHEFMRNVYNTGRISSTREIVSYDDVAAAIRRDTGIDIRALEKLEAEKVYKKHISRYADAYVVATIANSSKHPQMFFYVYNANTSELMYTYTLQSRIIGKRTKDYNKGAEDFFKQFDKIIAQNLSKDDRKKLKEKQKEVRKRKLNKINYKTGKSKADLVKKK